MTAIPVDSSHQRSSTGFLFIAAIGVVFGDIGTSPLYAIKETMAGTHPLPVDRVHVFGVLSLIFWSLLLVVSAKYVILTMRADNKGEGGSLSLLALLNKALIPKGTRPGRTATTVAMLSLCAAALFYGDSIITPAVSVLSAVEGIEIAAPHLSAYIEPLTVVILLALFAIQKWGTAKVGVLFGPIMIAWFTILAILGIRGIALAPEVLQALSPHYAIQFFVKEGTTGFLALGAVVLSVTGAEALYADMGHFGRLPIRLAWYLLVWPALLLNYFGQGALILTNPAAVGNPFFLLVPPSLAGPMVILATLATVIASQAVISGAFSITAQAIQLGYLPRMSIEHTSEKERGQIYVPFVNSMLALFVVALVLGFKSSTNLAAAYGVAVTGTMVITTILMTVVMRRIWGWSARRSYLLTSVFILVDAGFFGANIVKIPHGGWFPLAMGALVLVLLTTWKRGRDYLREAMDDKATPVELIPEESSHLHQVRGTAIYLAASSRGLPQALLHNLKHNQVLHERVVLMTVKVADMPYVPEDQAVETTELRPGLFRVVLHYGFMETPNIPRTLANARQDALGFYYEPFTTSYFVSRVIVTPTGRSGMAPWRESLFAWLMKNSTAATDFFRLPPDRVVELGSTVVI